MNYITTVDAAQKWGISPRRVLNLAKEGRIPGTVQIGSRWMIPDNATKPIDARTKIVKSTKAKSEPFFRYPDYEGHDVDSFEPPLSEEELTIKKGQEVIYACRFKEAEALLDDLKSIYESSENKYNRIVALRIVCMLNMMLNKKSEFFECYLKFSAELIDDFPHKEEMASMFYELEATLGITNYFINEFKIKHDYSYHESFMSHLSTLCIISLSYSDSDSLTPKELLSYEFICSYFEDKCHYIDSQTLHIYLGLLYAKMMNVDEMNYHYRKAFKLAEKYELYYQPAMLYYYYDKSFDSVLSEFSPEFVAHIKNLSTEIHKRYILFTESLSFKSIYNLLPKRYYIYFFFAVNGYSNKHVAKILNISQTNVGNKYSTIYEILGVKNKAELVEFYKKSIGNSTLGIK